MSGRDTICGILCNFQETLGHFINTNDIHVPNELDFDEMDLNKDGKVCFDEWKLERNEGQGRIKRNLKQ